MANNGDVPEELNLRLKRFALRVLKLCASLPNTPEARMFRLQLAKSGTSPGAHYREARRARSMAEFISKFNGGLQELDETEWWLDLLGATGLVPESRLTSLRSESNELIAIFVTCIQNTRRKMPQRPRRLGK